jgi:hypothetical protein
MLVILETSEISRQSAALPKIGILHELGPLIRASHNLLPPTGALRAPKRPDLRQRTSSPAPPSEAAFIPRLCRPHCLLRAEFAACGRAAPRLLFANLVPSHPDFGRLQPPTFAVFDWRDLRLASRRCVACASISAHSMLNQALDERRRAGERAKIMFFGLTKWTWRTSKTNR